MVNKMTLNEWIKKYEEKTGDEHCTPDGFELVFDEEKGYAQYKHDGNILFVYEACGDGKFWYQVVGVELAKKLGAKWIATICTRKIRPYMRLMGMKLTEERKLDFHGAISGTGINHLGNKLIVMPAWYDETKNSLAYYVYSEVMK